MDVTENSPRVLGSAYDLKEPSHDAQITEVGRGTPGGEWMRRYWHPVCLSNRVKDVPLKIRILGEDLVLFRDKKGRVGLVHPRCCHRGTTLFFGRVEDDGIRCCYHGWLFDVEGRCLDMPVEPDNGASIRNNVRQPWYPVQELYGLVWAYMGPPDKKPVLPRWSNLEDVRADQKLIAVNGSIGAGGDATVDVVPCNWLQDWENVMDPFHLPILHTAFSGVQFVPEFGIMPQVKWEYDPEGGMKYVAYRKLDDGREVDRVTYVLFPHVRIVPSVELAEGPGSSVGWVVPVDDTHFTLFTVMKVPKDFKPQRRERIPGKTWIEMNEDEQSTLLRQTAASACCAV
jgi:phenylpropionate dioxygenase-like ring-hydroxylating dioxygenase large terminal subunit